MNKPVLENLILDLLISFGNLKSFDISTKLGYSQRQIQRNLSTLETKQKIKKIGAGKNSSYQATTFGRLFYTPKNTDLSDSRLEKAQNILFNFEIFDALQNLDLAPNLEDLIPDIQKYTQKLAEIPVFLLDKERQRLIVEFSWKSSQIEGNTFSLLETEELLIEQNKPKNHTQAEIQMVLNHKKALDYTFSTKDYFKQITWQKITEIHKLLLQDMGVDSQIRKFGVGITGSLYKPLDNQMQIQEAIEKFLLLVNTKKPIESAFITSLVLPYIQPFNDGNKRTARVLANAILHANNLPILSFRSVNTSDYRNAVLAFYELNSLKYYQDIFIEQIQYFCKNYF